LVAAISAKVDSALSIFSNTSSQPETSFRICIYLCGAASLGVDERIVELKVEMELVNCPKTLLYDTLEDNLTVYFLTHR
jgi:hypothetical protein